MILSDAVSLQLSLAGMGVIGSSKRLLGQMISALSLDEGEIQFRPAGDIDALVAHRVPRALFVELIRMSGDEAGNADRASIRRMFSLLRQAENDSTKIARSLLAWLGSLTWPAEAVAGEGQLVRNLLAELDPQVVVNVLPRLDDPQELMGAFVLAAFATDDTSTLKAIGPALNSLLS
ncbi:hypothetical protein AB0M79_28690 [Polymorphospora sp. NPDC051019]|uniref:hypothetical protein n=1 Tax=Polymorphospora sp. NPDC051019 TaxID=3155725 RepID=UPI00343C6CB3